MFPKIVTLGEKQKTVFYLYYLLGYGPVSLVVTVKDYPKLILVAVRTELYFLPWDAPDGDSSLRLLSVVDLGLPDNRCNDGKVDAKGRLWFGTFLQLKSIMQAYFRRNLYTYSLCL